MSGVLNNSQVESISSSCTLEEIEDELSPNGKEETREVRWCRFR